MAARTWRRPWLAWSAAALALLLAPLFFTSSLAHAVLTQIGVAIIACLACNILLGQGGLLSFGHAIYSGFGSFATVHALNRIAAGTLAWPVSLLPLVGGLAGLALALPLGFVSTRRGGTAFAMITLGLGELVWTLAPLLPAFFGGEGGVAGNRVVGARRLGISFGPQVELYYLVAAYVLVCAALMHAFTRTPLGRMLQATRERPERVGFVGYDPRQVRFLAFLVSAFFMGVAGGLAALDFERVSAEALGTLRSGNLVLFTMLGGSTVFFGPVIGAVLMVVASVLGSEFTAAWLLGLGLAFMLMMMHAPGGVAGLVLAHLRVAAHGLSARLLRPYALLLATALPTLAALFVLLEMSYRLRADGPPLPLLPGVALDPRQAAPWLLAAALLLAAGLLLERARRRFVRCWDALQDEIAAGKASATGEGAR
jgi:branched-chain amino acid transport system permease protein